MSTLSLPTSSSSGAVQERLLQPPRLERYCPAEHCARRCGPSDCTCKPCAPDCPFCVARKQGAAPVRFEIQPTFEHRQLRLINNFTNQPEETKVSTAVITNGEILSRHKIGTEGIEHLDLEVPILTGPQAQGDILIVPVDTTEDRGELVPAKGITIVRGETEGGNAHILHALDGECFWAPAADAAIELVQGRLTVPEGSSATVVHTQEHNVIGVGPGSYEIKRQREFAGEWRRVSD